MNPKRILILFALSVFLTLSSCEPPKQQSKDNNFTFAFLTDIHIQPERHAIEGFRTAINKVNELKPDFVITGGDLVMDALGTRKSRVDSLYDIYTGMLPEFKMPVYNTIGNHEHFGWYTESGADPNDPEFGDKIFEKRIGPRYQRVDRFGWIFFILDSVVRDSTGGYEGGVDAEQIAWLKDQLSKIPAETPIVISVHIPLLTCEAQIQRGSTAPNEPGEVIVNSKEVEGLFKDHNLQLVLQGHLHYYEYMHVYGTTYITGGAVSARWWQGPYLGTEEGFVLLKVTDGKLSWEYIDDGWQVETHQ